MGQELPVILVVEKEGGDLQSSSRLLHQRFKVVTCPVESVALEYSRYNYNATIFYDTSPFRSSDHDPLVVGIDLQERCGGLVPTIRGTNGDDVLQGTNKRDVMMGLGGNDVIRGGNGDDLICGGAGTDVVEGGNGQDVVLGGFGDDVLHGDNGDDHLVGGPGTDVLDGGRGDNVLEQEGAES